MAKPASGGSRKPAGRKPARGSSKSSGDREKPAPRKYKVPDGVTLEAIVTTLVENYGWERLGKKIRIKCFTDDPSVKSSLTFLRRTPWAREKVEMLYAWREATGWDPRDNDK